jgi:hypothetical protein
MNRILLYRGERFHIAAINSHNRDAVTVPSDENER